MSQWQPVKVNITHMIDDLLKMYTEHPHEVLVIESIANALDAKASKIKITTEGGLYTIEDDGTGMTSADFEEKYHSLAFSTKKRGEGIGFAGVGAKLYLIFLDAGNKITTETRSKSFHGSSELTLVGGEPKWRKINSKVLTRNGTRYSVELHKNHQSLLVADKVMKIIQKHYNSILLGLTGEILIEVNGIEVPPRKVKGHSDTYNFNTIDAKTKKPTESTCHFYLSKDALDDDLGQGLEIVVFGKSIKHDWFVGLESIKPEFRKRITGYVLSDALSSLLSTNKADFRTVENPRLWANYRQRVYEIFRKWLQEVGAFQKPAEQALKTEMLIVKKDVEEEIAKVLKNPIISKYNPFMTLRKASVTVPSKDGEVNASLADGSQKTSGTLSGETEGNGTNVDGIGNDSSLKERPGGKEKGEKIPRNVRHGISIGFIGRKDDPVESWLTPDAIIINDAHSTFLRCKELGFTAEKLHLLRCVFMTLIENNPPETMREAFDDLRAFYKAWSNN